MVAEVQDAEQRIGPVDLTVRASSEHLRVLRLVTASLAASLSFDVDQLDDLRIAVDELCSLLIEHAPPEAVLRLKLREEAGRLAVDGALREEVPLASIDPVSQMILDGLDIEWSIDARVSSFCLLAPSGERRAGT